MTKTRIALGVLNYLPAGLVGGSALLALFRIVGLIDVSWLIIVAPVAVPVVAIITIAWLKVLHYYATTTPEERADDRLTRAIQDRAANDLTNIFGQDVTR